MGAVRNVSKRDFQKELALLDQLIRDGQGTVAKEAILNLTKTKIPREFVAPIAKIARRLNLGILAVRILRPIVHPPVPLALKASNAELACYAGCLAKIGARTEAQSLLKNLQTEDLPEVYFHQCTILFQEWNYGKAIPLLKKYIKHEKTTAYEKLAAKVNLAAALVNEQQFDDATELLQELRDLTKKNGLQLLFGNGLELSAQLEIFKKNFGASRFFLTEARASLGSMSNLSEFFIRKWEAVLGVFEDPSENAFRKLDEISDEARTRRHWETLRDCDFYRALARRNSTLMRKVYIGTPYSNYRKKIRATAEFEFDLTPVYDWKLKPAEQGDRIFDIRLGREISDPEVNLPTGQVLHKALLLLTQDFYRPVSTVSFFAALFKDEYYNPDSSPTRILQVIYRLRNWLNENRIPVEVVADDGEFYLVAGKPYVFRVYGIKQLPQPKDSKLALLKRHWPHRSFSASQASVYLKCSISAASRLLSAAYTSKKIFRSGVGAGITYRFQK